MLIAQGGYCAICSRLMDLNGRGGDTACVDHDHANGEIRFLLCRQCNAALGLFRDSSGILKAAYEYLERK